MSALSSTMMHLLTRVVILEGGMRVNVAKEDQLEHKLHYQGTIFGHNQTCSSYLNLWVIFKLALVMLLFFETILYLVFDMWHTGRFIDPKPNASQNNDLLSKHQIYHRWRIRWEVITVGTGITSKEVFATIWSMEAPRFHDPLRRWAPTRYTQIVVQIKPWGLL